MKKNNLNRGARIVSMCLGVIALIFLFISIFYESGNNVFLGIGLLCVCAAALIQQFFGQKNKDE